MSRTVLPLPTDGEACRSSGKSLKVKHVSNVFIVDYKIVNPTAGTHDYNKTIDKTAVFANPIEMIDFVTSYFGGRIPS